MRSGVGWLLAASLVATTVTVGPTPRRAASDDAVTVESGSIAIPTYRYEQALRVDPQAPFAPYERLDFAQVGAPRPKSYRTLVVRNRWLELTVLPELGGRLYRVVYLPTGQDLLYRNPAIKPTIYGARGWWLAAGGMEWAFPTDEHGYLEYVPWQARWERTAGGGAIVRLGHREQTTGLEVEVALTLEPDEAAFGVSPRVRSDLAEARRFQLWTNALVALGGNRVTLGTGFILPVEQIMLHSAGEPGLPQGDVPPGTMLDWPVHAGVDLRRPAAWRGTHFGGFAPRPVPFFGAHSTEAQLALARVHRGAAAPSATRPEGAKVFGWGPAYDRSGITDDGSDYLELWVGLTPSFWDWATIEPGGVAGWDDLWYPVPTPHPFEAASPAVTLGMAGSGDRPQLRLYAPRAVQARVEVGEPRDEAATDVVSLGPDGSVGLEIPPELREARELEVRILGEQDELLLGARCRPTELRCGSA